MQAGETKRRAKRGLSATVLAALFPTSAFAQTLSPFDHDDLVALALIAAIAGFAVLAAILLLRTRAKAAAPSAACSSSAGGVSDQSVVKVGAPGAAT